MSAALLCAAVAPTPGDARGCLYPLGATEPGHFLRNPFDSLVECGGWRKAGSPYCADHHAIAYRKPTAIERAALRGVRA